MHADTHSDDQYAPTGRNLKTWLFGGAAVPVANALFDVEDSGLAVIGDLFGEDQYFADSQVVSRKWWKLSDSVLRAV